MINVSFFDVSNHYLTGWRTKHIPRVGDTVCVRYDHHRVLQVIWEEQDSVRIKLGEPEE